MRVCTPLPATANPRIRSAEFNRAFTLIELILVMALLLVVVSLGAPSLSNFFRGRKLDSEARRFLSLTRYGQSRAVSEGVPMVLWIDLSDGTYGLRAQEGFSMENLRPLDLKSGWEPEDGQPALLEKDVEFRLPERLSFELDAGERVTRQLATMRFLPDGSIDEESLRSVYILQKDRDEEESVWITQSRTRLNYEILDKTNTWARAYPQAQGRGGVYVR